MQWIAAKATTGKEYAVRKKLKELAPEAEILVPRIYTKIIKDGLVRTKSERMLPGYILIGTPEALDRDRLKSFIKVIGRVTPDEIEAIMTNCGQKDGNLVESMAILVIDGPFQGCRGKIMRQTEEGIMHCRIVFQGMEIFMDLSSKILSSLTSKVEL